MLTVAAVHRNQNHIIPTDIITMVAMEFRGLLYYIARGLESRKQNREENIARHLSARSRPARDASKCACTRRR